MVTEDKSSINVSIYGEKYGIKSEADPEYTKRVAAYVDSAMHEITDSISLFDAQKVAILAAMSIADELFQAQAGLRKMQEEVNGKTEKLIKSLNRALNIGVEKIDSRSDQLNEDAMRKG